MYFYHQKKKSHRHYLRSSKAHRKFEKQKINRNGGIVVVAPTVQRQLVINLV